MALEKVGADPIFLFRFKVHSTLANSRPTRASIKPTCGQPGPTWGGLWQTQDLPMAPKLQLGGSDTSTGCFLCSIHVLEGGVGGRPSWVFFLGLGAGTQWATQQFFCALGDSHSLAQCNFRAPCGAIKVLEKTPYFTIDLFHNHLEKDSPQVL